MVLSDPLVPLVLALPAVAALVPLTGTDQRRSSRVVTRLLAATAVGALALFVLVAVGGAVDQTYARLTPGGVPVSLGVTVDRFGALFVLLVCGIAAVVAGYAHRYLDGEPAAAAFQARVAAATAATLVMATAPGLVQLWIGWTLAGWCLVGLIGHHREQPRVRAAVRRVRRLFALADLALLAAVALLAVALRDTDLAAVRAGAAGLPTPLLVTVGLLLLVACVVRSAQLPAHRWLPTTLYAPTPVSAFLHAGMVNVAGFLLIRLAPVVVAVPVVTAAILLVGLGTAAAGTLFAAVRTDVKGALARSTMAQMGFMLVQVGLGAFGLAALHLVGHGVYKAYAFLSAGGAVQARVAADQAPPPVGPRPAHRLLPALALLVATVLLVEVAVGGSPLAAGLAALAGVAALDAALRDRALPVRAALGLTAAVTGLAGGYLLLGALADRWLGLDAAVHPAGLAVTAVLLAGVALLVRLAPRHRIDRLWWWAWRDGVAPRPARRSVPTPRVPVVDRADGVRAAAAVAAATDLVGPAWPVDTFVAVNPLAGLEREPFPAATTRLRAVTGATTHLPPEHYRARYATGAISDADLTAALADAGLPAGPAVVLGERLLDPAELHRLVLRHGPHDGPVPGPALLAAATRALTAGLGPVESRSDAADGRTLAELLDDALGTRVAATVDDLVADWLAAHCGRAQARWPAPGDPAAGCWPRWRDVAGTDPGPVRHGVAGFATLVAALPSAPERAVAALLRALDVPESEWAEYLGRSFARLPGWAGYARWRATHPGDRPPLTPVELLAVRLAYELALGAAVAARRLDVPGTLPAVRAATATAYRAGATPLVDPVPLARLARLLDLDADRLDALPPGSVTALRAALDALPPHRQSEIWLVAAEHAYRRGLRHQLDRPTTAAPVEAAPTAQAVFCIDVRSEGLRRHLEAVAPVRTLGFAGFFGLPVRTVADGASEGRDRCPVLMRPVATVAEPADGDRADRRRTRQGWRRAYAGAKGDPVGAFVFVEVAGVLAAAGLLLRAAAPRWLAGRPEDPAVGAPELDQALELDERVYYAEATLRTMGLTAGFAPLVLLCGHGATSANNPYAAALDCGACGGNRGGVSARLAAALLNDPAVRAGLAGRGIDVPAGTRFVAGEHDTVTDEVRILDPVPAGHAEPLGRLVGHLAEAGRRLRAERAARLPDRPATDRVGGRSVDWAQVRPEWALAGNAAFIAAPRDLTVGRDLGCRTFLHSYDWSADPAGVALETIMTGPLVVAEWINLQYYFSSVDPERFGAGTKTVHTVLGDGIGVLSGAGGDLRTGLPRQSVSDGRELVHEPLRLLALVRAPRPLVDAVLDRNPALRDLTDGGWLHLIALDPTDGGWWQRTRGGWRELPPTPVPAAPVVPAGEARPTLVPSS
ncbi:putative inorganic carbon transporter subunit DabA [Micromonospora mangrovi]|uniref:Probable inorganic carbon transporter subunit DabA n=2 Tax=Micromonospora TaxID=1873 RepID=A0AAU8HL90_9ACTN